ncbi:hypothetical protein P5P86_18195 [Nocardioides sp. BP30]|uniref:hypothetical protein n=1 Tax=Nocardioides sp. BP30 TaxID=3036374 RepID=UPI0024691383|nr:hypothetical protein [Nocardioides sp. BP30]WGL51873.1 hypothetical protein P5P86_18195 [Nocardioides sp. BP30]
MAWLSYLSINYVPGSQYGYDDSGYQGTVKIVQSSRDPIATTTPFNQKGAVAVAITPGQPWTINLSQSAGESALDFYLNGYAMCDSSKPLTWHEQDLF